MKFNRSFLTALILGVLLTGFTSPAALAKPKGSSVSTDATSIPVSTNKSKKLSGFEGNCWNGMYTGGSFGRASVASSDGGILVSVRGRNLSAEYPYIVSLEQDNVIDGAVFGCQWIEVLNSATWSIVTFSDSSGNLDFSGSFSGFGDGVGDTFRVLLFDAYTGQLVAASGFRTLR